MPTHPPPHLTLLGWHGDDYYYCYYSYYYLHRREEEEEWGRGGTQIGDLFRLFLND